VSGATACAEFERIIMRIVASVHDAASGFTQAVPSRSRRAAPLSGAAARRPRTELGVAQLPGAYRASGGVATSDALTQLLLGRWDQPISVLARWIVDRRVVHFGLQGRLMLPLFQFDLRSLDVLPRVGEVIDALGHVLDTDEHAEWFARPNCWLRGASPAEAMAEDAAAVLQAARSYRLALEA
jgi:hypothetical protein